MRIIILTFFLSLLLTTISITSMVASNRHSKAIKILQENLDCARLNKNFVSIGEGVCFDESILLNNK